MHRAQDRQINTLNRGVRQAAGTHNSLTRIFIKSRTTWPADAQFAPYALLLRSHRQ